MERPGYDIDIEKFQKVVGHKFSNTQLIYLAFAHSSFVNEKKNASTSSYERLEFLGDSIVNMIVSEYLYNNCPNLPEGELTRIRAIVVCEPTFYNCTRKLGFGEFLLLGKGEKLNGGRERVSILADVFEAVTAAIYLDAGYEKAKEFALGQLKGVIADALNGIVFLDYKTQLQEILQKNSNAKIVYTVIRESGPDHDKEFVVQVSNVNDVLGEGVGKSKKEAEQEAAKEALIRIQKAYR